MVAMYVKRSDYPLLVTAAGKEGVSAWLRTLVSAEIKRLRQVGMLPK